jgi:hypothetical protein
VKRLLLAIAAAGLATVCSGTVQAHDPYSEIYDPYIEAPHPSSYDPYYQLHVIHYQLYRKSYPPLV